MSTNVFSIKNSKQPKSRNNGVRIDVTSKEFPVLMGMSLSVLTLTHKGFREPHWHPNANELSYCTKGLAKMTVFSPNNTRDTFYLKEGDLAFVPMGSIHHIENIGDSDAEFLLAFDNTQPEDLELSGSIFSMPAKLLGTLFDKSEDFFAKCQKVGEDVFIGEMNQEETIKNSDPSALSMNVHESNLQVLTKAGFVKLGNAHVFPILQNLACYYLQIFKGGFREPHWHPNAHELNVVLSGKAKITLYSPDSIETFEMNPYDMSFLPQGYFHDIENISDEPLKMAVFFSSELPSDIGLSGVMSTYSPELLSSLFQIPAASFEAMKKYPLDVFISGAG